jgi:hypothetical protein
MSDKKSAVEAIIQKWDGGERLVAVDLAKKAKAEDVKAAQSARPELARYMASDFRG